MSRESYLAPDKIEQKYHALHPTPLTGEQVYQQYCAACHGSGTYSRWDKKFNRFVPAIRGVSLTSTASREYLQANIEQGVRARRCPAGAHMLAACFQKRLRRSSSICAAAHAAVPTMTALTLRGDASNGLPSSREMRGLPRNERPRR